MSSKPKNKKPAAKKAKPAKSKAKMQSRPHTTSPVMRSQRVTMPVSYGTRLVNPGPRMTTADGNLRIRKSEMVDSITVLSAASGGVTGNVFRAQAFGLNPGNALLFPWLLSTAKCWTSYRFRSLSFRFMPTAPTSQSGVVMMAFSEDPDIPAPTGQAQFLDIAGVHETNVYLRDQINWRTQNDNGAWKRIDYTTAYGDLNTLNHTGAFLFGYQVPSNFAGEIGKLFVDYDVEFKTAQLPALTTLAPGASPDVSASTPYDSLAIGQASYTIPLPTLTFNVYNPFGNNPGSSTAGFGYVATTGVLNARSRQFASQIRQASAVSTTSAPLNQAVARASYDLLTAQAQCNAGIPSKYVDIVSDNLAPSSTRGFFPLFAFSGPGEYFITFSHTFYFTGAIASAVDPAVQSLSVDMLEADTASGVSTRAYGSLVGTAVGNRFGSPIYVGGFQTGFCCRLMFTAVIPSTCTFPVMARMPVGQWQLVGVTAVTSNETLLYVQPYFRFPTLTAPKSVDEDALFQRLLDRLGSRTTFNDDPETDDESVSNVPSGSGALSQSGFTLLSNLLTRHQRMQ